MNSSQYYQAHGKDVCDLFGLDNVGMAWTVPKYLRKVVSKQAMQKFLAKLTLNSIQGKRCNEKGTSKVCTLGGAQEMLVISESGRYTLIITSDKPQQEGVGFFPTPSGDQTPITVSEAILHRYHSGRTYPFNGVTL